MNSVGDVALRLEGWLSICDNSEQAKWSKRYCVLSQDDRSLRFFENKESVVVSSPLPVVHIGNDITEQQEESKHNPATARASLEGSIRITSPDHSDTEEFKRSTNQESSTSGFQRLRASLRNRRSSSKKTTSPADKKDDEKKKFTRTKSLTRGEGRQFSRKLNVESRQIGRSLDSLDHLGAFGGPNTAIDLGSSNPPVVRLCHPSIAPSENCFDIILGHAVIHCKCKEEEQMRVWVDSLKRCISWDRDLEAREDIDVTLWIMDVKGLPKKGNYHCELLLDSQLYARTTSKFWGDSLFWGEHFYFSDVPPISTVTVKLQREIDRKRKGRPGTSLVGTVEIKVEDVAHKQGSLVEKWYQVVSSQKQDGAALRVKARYQVVSILPLKVYKEFFQFLQTHYSTLCEVLEPVIPAKNKDEIAQTLIRILHSGGKSYDFLVDLVMAEVETLEDENLIFRGNTFATKAMDTYMKMVGDRYLKETLGQFVRYLYETEEECEVDPSRLPSDADLKTCQETLMLFVEKAWAKIVSSYTNFPTKLQAVFHGFRERLAGNQDNLGKKLISGSIFLRFFCPAILSPSLFHLVQAYPDEKAGRRLTLVAKVLQSLANFTRLGQKEDYMFCMDEFFERELPNMYHYIEKISAAPSETDVVASAHTNIDFGRELAIMHRMLSDHISHLSTADVSRIAPLSFILQSITNYSADSSDPIRSYSVPHLPDFAGSPLSFTNPINSELSGLTSIDWLANQHRFSSILQACHPSALHSIRSPVQKSPVHTLPSTNQRSNVAAQLPRRRSSPVLSRVSVQQHGIAEGGPIVSIISPESGSESSGSSGQGSPSRNHHEQSLSQRSSHSPDKQKAATAGSQGPRKMGKSHSAHPVFPTHHEHRRVHSGHDLRTLKETSSATASQTSLFSTVSMEEVEDQNHELRDQLSQSEVKARLNEDRSLRLTDNLKLSHEQLVTERSAHEIELEELKQELERTQTLLAQEGERCNELSKSLKRIIESEKQLKKEQREMRELLASKQHIIMLQQTRMRGLGTANAKLMAGLNDLHRRSPLREGMNGTTEEGSVNELSPDLMDIIKRLQNPGSDMT